MRLARKLFLLVAMAFAALAMTAGAASAQVEVLEEDGGHCSAVAVGVGHAVTGGCDVEYTTEHHIPLVAYTPAPVIVSNCNVHLSAQIGETGAGVVNVAVFTAETVNPPVPGCTRAPCDEATGQMLPWPVQILETGPSTERLEATFCLRTIPSGPGGPGTYCEVHLPFSQVGNHNHEVGDNQEYPCEVAAIPTAIRNVHFINETPANNSTEDIALIH